ncbi:MAG: response regulator [Desulfobacterales bacterium]|nr:response regulator [Desulfobacterales bacterium]
MYTNPTPLEKNLPAQGAIASHPALPAQAHKIEESALLARLAIDRCSDAAFWMEPNGRIFYVNDEACRILGYAREELLTKSVHEVDPNFTAHVWTQHWRSIRQNQRMRLESMLLTNCLTEKKQVERKIKEYEIRLGMSQRMEALGTLAGGIAHDFNNILSTILGYAELSLDGLPQEAPQRDYLREVLTAGTRARDLVHQILSFSRQAEHTVQPLQFKTIAKEALKLLRASIPSTIDIRANMASDGLVLADAGQLHQIVMNLCANAAQTIPAEGGVMNVSLETVTLDAEYAATHPGMEPGRYLRWMVCGTGKAIDACGTERNADPFFGAQGHGKGTGLSVVRGIVSEYSGHMFEERQNGNGTTVSVFLPLIERAKRPVAEPAENLPMGTGKEHILVVDDEPAVAKLVTMMLERMHYQVSSLTSSIEALALFKEKSAQFDLVITDLTMPNLPGQKLAAELNKIRPGIPIILCTGYSGEISDAKVAKTGIQATITKPIVKAALATTVRGLLDKTKAAA